MKKTVITSLLVLGLMACATHRAGPDRMVSIQIVDRNGFDETISYPDRLAIFQEVDFLAPQPYEKVVRVYGKSAEGKSLAKLTSYHSNGHIWQYLEVVSGRANGYYKEWHPNGRLKLKAYVIEGVGNLSGEAKESWVFEGKSYVWNEDGNLRAEIPYEKGVLSGESLTYYSDGAIEKKETYNRGKIDGTITYFDRNGQLLGEEEMFQGQRHGRSYWLGNADKPPYEETYRLGKLMDGHYTDSQGETLATVSNGKGRKSTYIKGKIEKITSYEDGVPKGPVDVYHPIGFLERVFHINGEIKNGEETIYYPAKKGAVLKPKLVLSWRNNQIQGKCRTYYLSGQMESEKEMYQNKKHGTHLAWYESGGLMLVEEYENDRLMSGKYYKKDDKHAVCEVVDGNGEVTLFDSEGYLLKRVKYVYGRPVE